MTAWLPSWCRGFYYFFPGIYIHGHKPYDPWTKNLLLRGSPQTAVRLPSRRVSLQACRFGLLLLLLGAGLSVPASANNVSIENAALVDQDETNDTIDVEFDVSWGNAWSDSTNHDAVWVFVKYRTTSAGDWKHATLATAGTNPSGVSRGTKQSGSAFNNIDIVVSADKKGAFIKPSHQTSGTLDFHDVQLRWDYGSDAVTDAQADNASEPMTVRVFGIEMVNVSEGAYFLGDDTNGTNGEFTWEASQSGTILQEDSAIMFESTQGTSNAFYYSSDSGTDDYATGVIFSVPASFPKGYKAFYVMKYEITEGQWVNFFNTLTSAQKTTRDITAASGKNSDLTVNRNTISWSTGDASTTRTDRACGYLSWMDVAAFADWAALRPMTEFEFEKAGRGPIYPVTGGYAWGSTTITAAVTISGTEDGTETITTSGANAHYNNTSLLQGDTGTGPLRAGIFATSSTNTRAATGASYYGIMELSGNVWERAVTVGNSSGLSFSGTHGDGILTSTSSFEGNATNLDWPGLDSTNNRGVTGAGGSGLKGGGWSETTVGRLAISSRWKAGTTDATRASAYGGRAVRTANS